MNTLRAQFSIDFQGKEIDCVLTMNAFRILKQDHGVNLDEIDKFMSEDPLTGLAALSHCGAKNAAFLKAEKLGIDFDHWCAVILDDAEAMGRITAAFENAMGGEPGNE